MTEEVKPQLDSLSIEACQIGSRWRTEGWPRRVLRHGGPPMERFYLDIR
jgi:hypothetical protein